MVTEIRPDLAALVRMAVTQLQGVAEAITDGDQAGTIQVAKQAKKATVLLGMIREELYEIRKASKVAVAPKGKAKR